MGNAATKLTPEGMMWDGNHLIERGLGTWHPVYDEDGRVKGAVRVPYPCVVPEVTYEEKVSIRRARNVNRRR